MKTVQSYSISSSPSTHKTPAVRFPLQSGSVAFNPVQLNMASQVMFWKSIGPLNRPKVDPNVGRATVGRKQLIMLYSSTPLQGREKMLLDEEGG